MAGTGGRVTGLREADGATIGGADGAGVDGATIGGPGAASAGVEADGADVGAGVVGASVDVAGDVRPSHATSGVRWASRAGSRGSGGVASSSLEGI